MTELLKKRITLSFTFDATVDDTNILNSSNGDDVKSMDLALLRQILATSPERVEMQMADDALLFLEFMHFEPLGKAMIGYPCEDKDFVKYCFTDAVDALPEPHHSDWQAIRDDPQCHFSEFVESITGCIEVEMVGSKVEFE